MLGALSPVEPYLGNALGVVEKNINKDALELIRALKPDCLP